MGLLASDDAKWHSLSSLHSLSDETFVNRKAIGDPLAGRESRILQLLGVEQRLKNLIGNTFTQALEQPVVAITELPVFLSSLYYMFVCTLVIGLSASINIFIQETHHFCYDQIGTFTTLISVNPPSHRGQATLASLQ
jgi:hypothetical protein